VITANRTKAMKTALILLLTGALMSCSMTVDPDGKKTTTLDGKTTVAVLKILAEK